MKKKIFMFVMAFAIIFPVAFLLSACCGQENPPEVTETGISVYIDGTEVNEDFNTIDICYGDYTDVTELINNKLTVVVNYSDQTSNNLVYDNVGGGFSIAGLPQNLNANEEGYNLTLSYKNFSQDLILIIRKVDIDFSSVGWNYYEPYTYDGEEKTVKLVNVPKNVEVTYQNDYKATNAGTYTATAIIEYDENNLPHRSVIKRPVEYAYLYLLNLENKEDEKFYRMKTAEASVYGASAIQNLGAKQTYMKRYVYMSVLDIVEPDEVDAAPQGNVQTVSQPAQQVTPQPPVNFTTNVAEMHKGPMSIQVDYEPQQPLELGPRIPQESLATNNVTIEATTGNVVVDEPMTLETKTAIAQLIITKGKNPAETIQEIAKNLGTPVEQFKESQKEQILQMIGSL